MTDDAPPFSLDIVHPKVVERCVPIPPPKEVDVSVVGIDARDMATAFRGRIAIGVNTVQAPPLSVWLAGLEVGLEEAGREGLSEERFGVPVSSQNDGGVEGRHDVRIGFGNGRGWIGRLSRGVVHGGA